MEQWKLDLIMAMEKMQIAIDNIPVDAIALASEEYELPLLNNDGFGELSSEIQIVIDAGEEEKEDEEE